jgi:hypothetical protein
MRIISATVDIAATRQEVWGVLADLNSYRDWNPFIQSASGQLMVGGILTMKFVPTQGRAMVIRPKVLNVQPDALLSWKGGVIMPGIFDGTHRFVLESSEGGTRVTQSEQFQGVLVPFMRGTIDATVENFQALNQALKERVERA